jgi:hypothetical protein
MKRAIALSLIMLLAVGIMLPLVPTEASNKSKAHYSNKRKKKIRKYSKAWWRRYRARMKRRRALLARKRALEANRTMYAKANAMAANPNTTASQPVVSATGGYYRDQRSGWSVTVPNGWSSRPSMEGGDPTFRVFSNGRSAGSATISVAGSAMPQFNDEGKGKNKTLGGVSVANFRRMVIDRMIREEGWVVNDYIKELNGRKVFVVVAQTPASNGQPAQTKIYYFTESGGRILSLATSASADMADRVATDSEKVLDSLSKSSTSSGASTAQAASLK